jgi:pSer/pThr/pTyr-binding forkhead associated (FHA) protein
MGNRNYRLTVIKGFNKGNVYPLETDRITIGRGEENGIVINIAEVSRIHTELTRAEEGYMIKDLGSTNGTFIDNKKVGKKYLLKPGDTVMLGDAIHMTYQAETNPDETLVSPRNMEFAGEEVTAATPPPQVMSPPPPPPQTPPPAVEVLSKAQVTEEKKGGRTWLWAGIGCLVVIIFLIVIGLIIFDYLNLYCTPPFDSLFSFLYSCQY